MPMPTMYPPLWRRPAAAFLISRGISPLITSLQSLSSGIAVMSWSYLTISPSLKRTSFLAMLMKSTFLLSV
jgi:hypothetical protein